MNTHFSTLRAALFRLSIICTLASLLPACLHTSDGPQLSLQQHPLVGKIWHTEQQAFITKADVLEQLSGTEYLLLGERHDNPVHHQHQAWFIEQLQAANIYASVAFEMIDSQQGQRLAEQPVRSADQMIAILNESEAAWQYEIFYKDLFAAVIAAGFPVDAANLNREQLMHIVKQTSEPLSDAYKRMLDQGQLSDQQLSSLRSEIMESHCDMLNDTMTDQLVLGQRLRDAVMAHSLVTSNSSIKVLIAGAGHARNDRGIPAYLGDSSKVLSIGFIEVERDNNEPDKYAEYWNAGTLPFDIVWFTPRVKREDPCEQLRKHFEEKHSQADASADMP